MSTDQRDQRLHSDLAALQALKAASTIFDFEAKGDPPDRYTLTFRGRGLARESSSRDDVQTIDLHSCDVRLPYSYPDSPPDVRWQTPIFHPNVSFSGFLNLREIGLTWDKELGLDVVCERLWDVARGASASLDSAANLAARRWYAEQGDRFGLPVDRRPLRDRAAPRIENVVRYRRRGVPEPELAAGDEPGDDVLYIGDDTPSPVPPVRRRPANAGGDDDVLYIGPD